MFNALYNSLDDTVGDAGLYSPVVEGEHPLT